MKDFHDWYFENHIDDMEPSWVLVERAYNEAKKGAVSISKLQELIADLKDCLIEIPEGNGKTACRLSIVKLQKLIDENSNG